MQVNDKRNADPLEKRAIPPTPPEEIRERCIAKEEQRLKQNLPLPKVHKMEIGGWQHMATLVSPRKKQSRRARPSDTTISPRDKQFVSVHLSPRSKGVTKGHYAWRREEEQRYHGISEAVGRRLSQELTSIKNHDGRVNPHMRNAALKYGSFRVKVEVSEESRGAMVCEESKRILQAKIEGKNCNMAIFPGPQLRDGQEALKHLREHCEELEELLGLIDEANLQPTQRRCVQDFLAEL